MGEQMRTFKHSNVQTCIKQFDYDHEHDHDYEHDYDYDYELELRERERAASLESRAPQIDAASRGNHR